MNDSLTPDPAQFVQHEQGGAGADGHVRDVEGGPVPAGRMEIEEIDDVAIHHAVDDIADCAAQDQGQRPAEHVLAGMLAQQVDDEDHGRDRNRGEEVALPAGLSGKEAECSPLVVREHKVEEGGHRVRIAIGEQLADSDLGDLVDQDHDGGNAEPGRDRSLFHRGGKAFLDAFLFRGHSGQKGWVSWIAFAGWRHAVYLPAEATGLSSGELARFALAKHIAHATAADVRMVVIRTHIGAVVPAALAFLVGRGSHDHAFLGFARDLGDLGL